MAFGRKLRKGAIDSDRIKDATILAADIKLFLSAEQTGTGASQSVPHGLGTTPSKVLVFVTGDARGAWAVFSIVEGAHDATNVVVTVTASIKFRVLAIA